MQKLALPSFPRKHLQKIPMNMPSLGEACKLGHPLPAFCFLSDPSQTIPQSGSEHIPQTLSQIQSRHLAVSQNHVGKWKIKTSGASPSSLHVEPRRRLRRTGRPELEPQDPVGGAAVCRGGPLRQEAPRNSWHVALEQADRSRLHARVFCLFVLAWGISTWNERIAPSFSSSFLESCGLFFLPSIFVLSTQMVVFSCWAFDGCAFLGGYPLLAGFQGKPKGTPVFCGPTLKKTLPSWAASGFR